MSDPFIGEIRIFAFTFAPIDWAFCNGQIMNIAQNQSLFAVLGTTFGGNGNTTFGLPNLQARAPLDFGHGSGLSQRNIGQTGGAATVALTPTQLPAHTHAVNASSAAGNLPSPNNAIWAQAGAGRGTKLYSATSAAQMSPAALSLTGNSQPHNNMMPYLPLNFCISLAGVFPARPS